MRSDPLQPAAGTSDPSLLELSNDFVSYWREQLENRFVPPESPWHDKDVMVVVRRFIDALDRQMASVVEPLNAEEAIKAELQREPPSRSGRPVIHGWTSTGCLCGHPWSADAARTASVAGLDRAIEKVASEHGIFVGGYSWWCCGPHPGTNEPDEDHNHAEFDFGKKGSRKATRHFIDAVLAALNSAPSIEQEPGEHRLLFPPHPDGFHVSSALCSCGDWQYDHDTTESLLAAQQDVRRDHVAHIRAALREQEPGETLRAALSDHDAGHADELALIAPALVHIALRVDGHYCQMCDDAKALANHLLDEAVESIGIAQEIENEPDQD